MLSGCGSLVTYQPPAAPDVTHPTSLIINKSKNQLWHQLLQKLTSDFFVVNNIEKASGFINLSFSAEPTEYLDCGQLNISDPIDHTQITPFPGATPHLVYNESVDILAPRRIDRKIALSGRVNLLLTQLRNKQTRLAINIKYIVSKSGTINRYAFNDTITFNSNQQKQFPGAPTVCQSNGKLEQRLLDLTRL